jgi:hypothetical protein
MWDTRQNEQWKNVNNVPPFTPHIFWTWFWQHTNRKPGTTGLPDDKKLNQSFEVNKKAHILTEQTSEVSQKRPTDRCFLHHTDQTKSLRTTRNRMQPDVFGEQMRTRFFDEQTKWGSDVSIWR